MTSPAPNAPPAAGPPSTARWLNLVTTMALAAVVFTIAFAAAPSLLRAGIGAAAEPEDFPPPVRGLHPTLVPQHHPGPAGFEIPSEDDERDDGDTPPKFRSTDPRFKPPRIPADDDDSPGGTLGLRAGVTMRPLVLRDRRSNSVIHEVRAGEGISVLREDGDWVLVAHESDSTIVTGWARKSELLLR